MTDVVTGQGGLTADPDDLPADPGPTVRVISDPKGMPLAKPLTVDLSRADPATGQIRKIIKTTDPQRYGIRVSDYLLA